MVPFSLDSHLEGVPPPRGAGKMLPSAQGQPVPTLVPCLEGTGASWQGPLRGSAETPLLMTLPEPEGPAGLEPESPKTFVMHLHPG